MEQKQAPLGETPAGDKAGFNVVDINLTAKLLKKAAPQIFFERYKWLPFPYLLLVFGAFGAAGAMLLAAINLVQIGHSHRLAVGALANAMRHPEIQQVADWPAFANLLATAAKLVNNGLGDQLNKNVLSLQLGGAMPFLVLTGIFFYGHIKQKLIAPHTLTVRFDAAGLQVQRGDSRIHHPWSAVAAIVFQQPPGKLHGFVLVRLQFGYTYVWPEQAFPSREHWQYTGHQLSALHLAARQAQVQADAACPYPRPYSA